MTAARPGRAQPLPVVTGECCAPGSPCASRQPAPRDAGWHGAARAARWLARASLAWMCAEGAVGLWQGLTAGSVALTGWALGSAVEGLASVIVIWRFTGARALSETSERRAQQAVAGSFALLAPYIAAESAWHLASGQHAEATVTGIALTAVALAVMPLLGRAKHRLATRLGSPATAGEGAQNYLCAAQAAAVLLGLAVTAAWPVAWWADPVAGLAIAAAAARESVRAWHGDDCRLACRHHHRKADGMRHTHHQGARVSRRPPVLTGGPTGCAGGQSRHCLHIFPVPSAHPALVLGGERGIKEARR